MAEAEQADVGTTGNPAQAELPAVGGSKIRGAGSEVASQTPATAGGQFSSTNRSGTQRGRSMVIGKMHLEVPGNRKVFELAALNDYAKFLVNSGFEMQAIEANKLVDNEQSLRTGISDSNAAVILLTRESDSDAYLDDIVGVLSANAAQNLLINCRISQSQMKSSANCLKKDFQMKLTNLAIISCAVATSKEVDDFFSELLKLHSSAWTRNGGGIRGMMNELRKRKDDFAKFCLKRRCTLVDNFEWNLQEKMLATASNFAGIIGDGSQLKQLDPSVLLSLLNEARENGDPLSHLVYKSHSERRALIINNVEFLDSKPRTNSDVDCANVRHLLMTLGYSIQEEWNLKAEEMKSAVMNFANSTDKSDFCILVVMSHGTYGKLKGVDDEAVDEADLLGYMRTGRGITGKPRLAIFQACQKMPKSSSVMRDVSRLEQARNVTKPMYGNCPLDVVEPTNEQCGLIVAHSTSPGDYAFRGDYGSRFILALCGTFYEYAHKEDVVSMITRVNFVMTHGFRRGFADDKLQPMQLPCWTVQTDRKLYLVDTGPLVDPHHNAIKSPEGVAAQVSEQ